MTTYSYEYTVFIERNPKPLLPNHSLNLIPIPRIKNLILIRDRKLIRPQILSRAPKLIIDNLSVPRRARLDRALEPFRRRSQALSPTKISINANGEGEEREENIQY